MVRFLFLLLLLLANVAMAQPIGQGNVVTSRANKFTATQTFSQSISNYTPATTRQITLDNPSGSYSWIDFLFGATYRAAIGANSSGQLNLHYGAGQCTYFNRGLSSYSTDAAMCAGRLYMYGYGNFRDGVNAGSNSDPTSTLHTQGTLGLKTVVMTSSGNIPSNASVILCDGTNAAGCIGTPTYPCSNWTNQTDCDLRNSHGGCVWTPSQCPNYSGDQYSCENNSCIWESAPCSTAYWYDQYSCEAIDDSYGGNCYYNSNSNDCSPLGYDDCNSHNPDCTWYEASYSDCSSFNGDQSTCESYSGQCTYNTETSECTGTYESSPAYCSGTYYDYSCDGDYYTGACSGGTAYCSGTPSCNPISQVNCPNEPGCTYASALNANLYAGVNDRTIKIVNDSSTNADCIINAASGETVRHASSLTLASRGDSALLTYFFRQESCSSFNEGACTPTGCSPSYSNCSWDSMNNICSGNSVCDPISDQSTCENQQYFSGCSGYYTISKNWH